METSSSILLPSPKKFPWGWVLLGAALVALTTLVVILSVNESNRPPPTPPSAGALSQPLPAFFLRTKADKVCFPSTAACKWSGPTSSYWTWNGTSSLVFNESSQSTQYVDTPVLGKKLTLTSKKNNEMRLHDSGYISNSTGSLFLGPDLVWTSAIPAAPPMLLDVQKDCSWGVCSKDTDCCPPFGTCDQKDNICRRCFQEEKPTACLDGNVPRCADSNTWSCVPTNSLCNWQTPAPGCADLVTCNVATKQWECVAGTLETQGSPEPSPPANLTCDGTQAMSYATNPATGLMEWMCLAWQELNMCNVLPEPWTCPREDSRCFRTPDGKYIKKCKGDMTRQNAVDYLGDKAMPISDGRTIVYFDKASD